MSHSIALHGAFAMAHFFIPNPHPMIHSLQALRVLFAFCIFVHHLGCFEAGGSCGVSFFFLLGGFALSAGYADKVSAAGFSWSHYMGRRLLRMYPLHLVTLLAALCVRYVVCDESHFQETPLLANILLLQSWFPWYSVFFSGNPVSWYLSDLLFYYALFPGLVRLWKTFGASHRQYLAAALFFAAAGYLLFQHYLPGLYGNQLLYIHPLFRLPDFLLGCATFYIYRHCQGFRITARQSTFFEILSICLVLAAVGAYYYLPANATYALLFWLPSSLLVLSFALGERQGGFISSFFKHKYWQQSARYAFSFYMSHWMCIRLVEHMLPEALFWQQVLLSFMLSVAMSLLLYYCIEQPLQALLSLQTRFTNPKS